MNEAGRFLALGDSYTIGEGVEPAEGWPIQLGSLLRAQGVHINEPEVIARTGWTTAELQAAVTAAQPRGPYALVSLLIGVNNQYRGLGLDQYRTEFRSLLASAITFAGSDPARVIVLNIPDWGVTPFAAGRDRDLIRSEIDAFNAANREEAMRVGAGYIDVAGISREPANREMVATDGLHPSGEMYRLWAELALPKALRSFGA